MCCPFLSRNRINQRKDEPNLLNVCEILCVQPAFTMTTTPPPNEGEKLRTFLCSQNMFPPAHADEIYMTNVRDAAELIQPGWWDSLGLFEQVKLSFLVLRQQPTRVWNTLTDPSASDAARTNILREVLRAALDEATFSGKRLHAYVRKGGDLRAQELQSQCANPDLLATVLLAFPQFSNN